MLGEKARAGAGQGAIDRRQKTAAPLAREALGQFEVAPRRGVDLHDRAGENALRWHQIGGAALLCQRDVIDERAGGGDLGPSELAEPVERLNAIEVFKPPPRRLAVKPRIG